MPNEIERRFLVRTLPDVSPFLVLSIDQAYLECDWVNNRETRIRRINQALPDAVVSHELTVKRGHGLVREEEPTVITPETWTDLLATSKGNVISKIIAKYHTPAGIVEHHQYHGIHAGLEVFEVEFPSPEAAEEFVPLPCFGREITGDRRFSNASIALYGIPLVYTCWRDDALHTSLRHGEDQAIESLARIILNQPHPPHMIIGFVGGSASGKSRKARELVAALGDQAMIVGMDSYYHSREWFRAQAAADNPLTFDEPQAIDLAQLRQDTLALARGESVRIPEYTYGKGVTALGPPVDPKPIIIIDGLFTLDKSLIDLYDLTLYIDIDRHGRIIRRLLRDVQRSGQSLPEILRYFGDVVEPMHDRHVVPARRLADLVMANPYQPATEASRSGSHELQVKFRISDEWPGGITWSTFVDLGELQQTDWYYCPSDHDMRYHGEMIRIRCTNGPSETPEYLFTYKGPMRPALWRKRAKLEFELDAASMAAFLSLYGPHVTVVEKRRHLYQFGSATVAVDDVKLIAGDVSRDLGRFVEFRTTAEEMSEEELIALVRRCGFDPDDGITTSYIDM